MQNNSYPSFQIRQLNTPTCTLLGIIIVGTDSRPKRPAIPS